MPAIYHEGSWLGNATDPEVLVKDTVGWTGKNLYKTENMSGNTNVGITTTKVGGVVTLNGTTTGEYIFPTDPAGQDYYDIEAGKSYIFSTETENADIELQVYVKETSSSSWTRLAQDTTSGNELSFTMPNSFYDIWVRCLVRSRKTLTNVTIYPMLRRADITDPTYEPYHPTVEEEIEQIYADNGVLGAKNLLKVTANTQTLNGVTFTVNRDSDGNVINVTVSGTASAITSFVLRTKTPLTAGKSYIMSRGEVGDNDFQMVATAWNSGSYVKNIIEIGAGGYTEKSFVADYNGYNDIQISIFVRSGKTISNAKVYPMLRLASDPDDTYQPHAMTNRELTEEKINIADLKTVVSASSDFADFKTRIASL